MENKYLKIDDFESFNFVKDEIEHALNQWDFKHKTCTTPIGYYDDFFKHYTEDDVNLIYDYKTGVAVIGNTGNTIFNGYIKTIEELDFVLKLLNIK